MADNLPPAPNLSSGTSGGAQKPWGCGAIAGVGCGVIVLASVLIGVVSTLGHDDKAETADMADTSKYDQTWSTPYSQTTCDDWLNSMSSREQFAAAADILTSARNKIDDGTGLPSDALVDEFAGGITTVCVEPTMTLTDATYGLYATEPRFHP